MADVNTHAETPAPSLNETRRSPYFFWVGVAAFLIILVFLGFGSTYGRQLAFGLEVSGQGVVETDWVIHLHTAVFVGWMALLLAQTILAARGQTQAHMALGGYGGIVLGILVVVVGGLITYVQAQAAVAKGLVTWEEWPALLEGTMVSWLSLLCFTLLLGLGLFYRSRPEVHKRYMVLGTAVLVMAAFGRMEYLLGSWSVNIGMGLVVAPLLAYDLYTEGRVRPATLIGTGVVWVSHGVPQLFG
jgi:hypothetical protein